MARNRWIYALADRGLVVACSKESGGTWAGAIEALRHGFPVYTRRGNPERPGNEALIEHGARPIGDDFSIIMRDEVTQRVSTLALQDQSHIDPQDRATHLPIPEEIYAAVAPILLRLLRESLTANEVVERTELPKTFVARWLKRLVDEGLPVRVKTRYHAVGLEHAIEEQPSLFPAKWFHECSCVVKPSADDGRRSWPQPRPRRRDVSRARRSDRMTPPAPASIPAAAGVSGLVAGAMSMAAGEYVSVSSQADSERAGISRERRGLQDDPMTELEELAGISEKRGLESDLARRVATQLMERDALGAHERDELRIPAATSARPVQAALASAASFLGGRRIAASAGHCGAGSNAHRLSLHRVPRVPGTARGGRRKSGGAPMLKATIRVTFWGALAMAVTAGIGAVFGNRI